MGLFSSIGSVLGGIGGALLAPATGGASIIAGAGLGSVIAGAGLGSAIGGAVDSNKANKSAKGYYNQQMDFAKEQAQFNQDYVRNAIQWRIDDAKKAGVHPMAALGFQSPSYSAVSAPSAPSYSIGAEIDPMEFGQNLNYASTKAKDADNQKKMLELEFEGKRLDNEYKRALIDQVKVDSLASSIATNQAFNSPSSPTINASEPINAISPYTSNVDSSSKGVHRLFDLGIHGNSVMLVPNPDIADSISESTWNTLSANIIREAELSNHDVIDDIISKLPKGMRNAIDKGEMRLVTAPGSGVLRLVPVGPNEEFDRYKVSDFY